MFSGECNLGTKPPFCMFCKFVNVIRSLEVSSMCGAFISSSLTIHLIA